ncbi:hypothetical protein [Luteimonas sp. R10]|uniref:hypothetical protein n=1 Tax=Luteimonas sp. R10 TaxID=3108176 RepID=UPI00308F57AE|nr:hypothetical protein U3649_04215 [Luteimonas sp. R10]
MKKHSIIAIALALLLPIGSVMAAVVHVSGHGVSHDPGIALEDARADAAAQCTSQGGAPVEEVYYHLSWAARWLASSVWSCEVP